MGKDTLELKVNKAIDEIRPFLIADGGDILLESIESNVVNIKLLGACTNCSINKMTLVGVEETIKKQVPEITEVVVVG
jgi:Fe-S cluster biogenesis protein NfuA